MDLIGAGSTGEAARLSGSLERGILVVESKSVEIQLGEQKPFTSVTKLTKRPKAIGKVNRATRATGELRLAFGAGTLATNGHRN